MFRPLHCSADRVQDGVYGHRHAFREVPEILPDGLRTAGSRCHPRFLREARELRSLHILSDPIANTSCKSLSKRKSPLAGLCFSAVERARAGCYECWRLEDPQGFITGLSNLSFVLSRAASDLWDKFNAIVSLQGIGKYKTTVTPKEPGVAIHLSDSWRESLKVIALDKVNVNANLCPRFLLSQISGTSMSYGEKLLQKDKLSPNLRLAE